MLLIINRGLLKSDPELFYQWVNKSFEKLNELSFFYPQFDLWYANKVIPGLEYGNRSIILSLEKNLVHGIAIVKHDKEEQKLCCLRVSPDLQGTGLGIRLFKKSFDILENERPLLSVAEEQMPKFRRVFSYFGFTQELAYKDLYRENKTELSYNGILRS